MGNKANKCCCPGCQIATDKFQRPDAETLGPKWEESGTGGWGISGNVAYMNATEQIAIFDIPHKKNDESMEAYYEVVDEVSEAIYYILVNVLDDDNYHIAKFHNTAVNPKIELGKVVGGAYTSLKEELIVAKTLPAPCDHMPRYCRRFYARIAPDEFCAGIGEATLSLVTAEPTIIAGGVRSGMGGMIDDGVLWFDNFYFGEHLETNRYCPTCICQCEDTVVGHKLIATFSGNGRMEEVDGCEIELFYERDDGWWRGEGDCCVWDWVLELYCPPEFTAEEFELRVIEGCIASDTDITEEGYIDEGWRRALAESTCDPFYLKFGPFNVSSFDLACGCGNDGMPPWGIGEYWIEITKEPGLVTAGTGPYFATEEDGGIGTIDNLISGLGI